MKDTDITIYTCKDGRKRVYIKSTQKVVSYPRFLLEQHLGRKLAKNEQVHHIDGNPQNNNLENLEIVLSGVHQKMHSQKYFDTVRVCPFCKKEFVWTAKQQRYFYSNISRKKPRNKTLIKEPFCSKQCCGKYVKQEQLRGNL